jgi:putative FmdB family regulatory protein
MPLYRYECTECGHEFRILHQQGDNKAATCPSCESTELHRLPSRVSVQFKGSGYYKTDRANNKSKAGTKGLSEKETSAEGSSGDSKDSRDSKDSKSDSSGKSDKPSKSD